MPKKNVEGVFWPAVISKLKVIKKKSMSWRSFFPLRNLFNRWSEYDSKIENLLSVSSNFWFWHFLYMLLATHTHLRCLKKSEIISLTIVV